MPGEPITTHNPNEGSVKRRNEKKRMRQRRAFILVCAFLFGLCSASQFYDRFSGTLALSIIEFRVVYHVIDMLHPQT